VPGNRAELVIDDATALREHLETATGERVSALEGVGIKPGQSQDRADSAARDREVATDSTQQCDLEPDRTPELKRIEHDLGL